MRMSLDSHTLDDLATLAGLALEQTLKKSLNLSRALGMEKNMIPQHVGYAAMIIVAQIQVKNLSYCLAKKSEKNEKHFRQDSGLFSARKLAHLPLSPNTEPAAAPPSALFQKSSLPRIEAATDSVKAKMPPMAANVKP